MTTRIAALVFIFACTSVAWLILGNTIFSRTYHSDPELKEKVESSWGSPQKQQPPTATYSYAVAYKKMTTVDGKSVEQTAEQYREASLPLETSRIDVSLDLTHRQKGLLWYSTYVVGFSGTYQFRNNTDHDQTLNLAWRFPAEKAIYDDLTLSLNGMPLSFKNEKSLVIANSRLAAGQLAVVGVSYRSQGLDTWQYDFGPDVTQVRDFSLQMATNFRDVDFPENALSPVEKQPKGNGWELTWRYKNLVSGYNIAMVMPAKLQPGPLAGQISYFAPVSLFFFFFVLFIVTTLRGMELHPMNYFFLAAAFFAFHLLLAYLVDHLSIHLAFFICSIVSVGLVVSYLRLVVGLHFAVREAGLAQIIYLVLFSYAFFFKGFTGLSVTIGAILTLFVVMQATGRLNWRHQFARPATAPTA
ncbi:MAG TPA: inner membrane CreD family protein [Bryobacteraceae bacterium]|nr:inner membrane CreD family protein [Bryobacteraceae bacterium]